MVDGRSGDVPDLGTDRAQAWQWSLDALSDISRTTSDHGVTVAVEPTPEDSNLIESCDDALELMRQVSSPSVKVMFDTNHAFCERSATKATWRWRSAFANLLTWYAGVANSKLAAYIKVFHESEDDVAPAYRWEHRLQRLKERGLDPQNLNIWITVVYFALALLSVAIPYATAGYSHSGPGIRTFLPVSALLFIASAVLVVRFSYPRERYEAHWRKIQQEEEGRC